MDRVLTGRPRGRPRKALVVVSRQKPKEIQKAVAKTVPKVAPDHPYRDVPIPSQDGRPSGLTVPVQFVPWVDTIPKDELHQALLEDDSPRSMEFLALLANPLKHDLPISALAMQCGIRTPALLEIWRNHMKVAAMGVALSQAPLVARDTLEDAKSVIVCCGRCDGAGSIRVLRETGYEWIKCATCRGKGEVRRAGDPKSREWVLRAANVIAADQGVVVNLQNNIQTDSVLDELDRLDAVDVGATVSDDS